MLDAKSPQIKHKQMVEGIRLEESGAGLKVSVGRDDFSISQFTIYLT
jgi:hypothetical protein